MRYAIAGAWIAMTFATSAGAQTLVHDPTAAEHLVQGDNDHVAMNASAALDEYQAAIQAAEGADSTVLGEALERAARESVAVAGGDPGLSDCQRSAYFRRAESYARRAVETRPGSAEAHFQLALALGSAALTVGPRDQVRYALLIRAEAVRALEIDPRHSGALHVIGWW